MKPRLSICMPTLNSRRFLEARLESIRAQTFSDWELVVVDGFSDDGTWEIIREFAADTGRVRAHRAAPEGIYPAINRCIGLSRGEYLYVATSDDTMADDCLGRLVAALEDRADCDIAHCRLRVLDEHGNASDPPEWWARTSMLARSSGDFLNRTHIRKAPFDGLLHLLGESVYVSLTQLVIRRSLFDRIGPFESRWGSVGDFNWMMRATLVANTIHLPDTWGGWRIHPGQATASAFLQRKEHAMKVDQMVAHALEISSNHLAPPIRASIRSDWQRRAAGIRHFFPRLRRYGRHPFRRRMLIVAHLLSGSWAARYYLRSRLTNGTSPETPGPGHLSQLLQGVADGPFLVAV